MSVEVIEDQIKVIIFHMHEEEYAIKVSEIQSIERMQSFTRIPGTAPFVRGVMNLRGVITPIIDLRLKFGLEGKESDESTRILVTSNEDLILGLVVDGANDVMDIPVSKIEPTPEVVGGVEAHYLDGVVKLGTRLFSLLDLEKVMQD
ncbi:chemotaxis protein CheW [Alkalicoccobacillus murimartini]|jgi:purine-binding chemotaxis protein CheW|uniref:Purine-binding chemotaxis protein CheW n=1 Tax=Alkalicoccobacillus murimartini TaxID=171685 RepID=A0ABT9YJE5_9BACI|nr:chemotaxis protein CheW [Alkalicoccobacillus murimartini]MDQ0207962.1 purine-binding chemotaxis protein CheW [Alkalicoccobacillus murimartini]